MGKVGNGMALKRSGKPLMAELVARAKERPLYATGIILGVFVLIIVAWVKMSERHDRVIAADITRATNLVQIQVNIQKFFLDHEQLPANLPELEGDPHPNPNFIRDAYLFDPETGRPYEYKVLTLRSYQLCTNFHYAHQVEDSAAPPGVEPDPIWEHGAGHSCFKSFVTRDPKSK